MTFGFEDKKKKKRLFVFKTPVSRWEKLSYTTDASMANQQSRQVGGDERGKRGEHPL